MALGPGLRSCDPKAVPSTTECPLPDSPRNVRSSSHLMRAFIEATQDQGCSSGIPVHARRRSSTLRNQAERIPRALGGVLFGIGDLGLLPSGQMKLGFG